MKALSSKGLTDYFHQTFIYFKKYFIYLFLERGKEGEREEEKQTSMCERNTDWLPLACPQHMT